MNAHKLDASPVLDLKPEQFDAGPLLTLKPELDLDKLKENAFIEEKYIDTIIKIIDKNKDGQRFVVNWGADENQKMEVWLGATLPSDATPQQTQELKAICGHAIVALKDLPGIVHDTLSTMHPKEEKYLYKGGLSFFIKLDKQSNEEMTLKLEFTNRSTRQYHSQLINKTAEMSWFFDFKTTNGTIYDKQKKQFTHRKYNRIFHIERSSIMPITDIVAKVIDEAVVKKYKSISRITIDTSSCDNNKFEEIWKQQYRYNKDNLANALLTTICVACGYNDHDQPGQFWPKLEDQDKGIVSRCLDIAKEANITLDLNKIPKELKEICGENDFSTTALMFAAKKTDLLSLTRLSLVILLIKNGADPDAQDNNLHDASWYAQQAGNTEIAEYLDALSRCRKSIKNGNQININDFVKIIKFTAQSENKYLPIESIDALLFLEKNYYQFNFDFALKFIKKFPKMDGIIKTIEMYFIKNLTKDCKDIEFTHYEQYRDMALALKNQNVSTFLVIFDSLDFSEDIDIYESAQSLQLISDYTQCDRSLLTTTFEQFITSEKENLSKQSQDNRKNLITKLMIARQFLYINGEYKQDLIEAAIKKYLEFYENDRYASFMLTVTGPSSTLDEKALSTGKVNQWLELPTFKSRVLNLLHHAMDNCQVSQIILILKYYPNIISDPAFQKQNTQLIHGTVLMKEILEYKDDRLELEKIVNFLLQKNNVAIFAKFDNQFLLSIAKEHGYLKLFKDCIQKNLLSAIKNNNTNQFNYLNSYYAELLENNLITPKDLFDVFSKTIAMGNTIKLNQLCIFFKKFFKTDMESSIDFFFDPHLRKNSGCYHILEKKVKYDLFYHLLQSQNSKLIEKIINADPAIIKEYYSNGQSALQIMLELPDINTDGHRIIRLLLDKGRELIPTELSENSLNRILSNGNLSFIQYTVKEIFMTSCKRSELEKIKLILSYYPQFLNSPIFLNNEIYNINADTTPLMFAVRSCNFELVHFLLNQNNINLWTTDSRNKIAEDFLPSFKSQNETHKKIKQSIQIKVQEELRTGTALIAQDIDKVKEILRRYPSSYRNITFQNGKTPLELVLENKPTERTDSLISMILDKDSSYFYQDKFFDLISLTKQLSLSKLPRLESLLSDILKMEEQRLDNLTKILIYMSLKDKSEKTYTLCKKFVLLEEGREKQTEEKLKSLYKTEIDEEENDFDVQIEYFNPNPFYENILKVKSSAVRLLLLNDYINLIYQQQLLLAHRGKNNTDEKSIDSSVHTLNVLRKLTESSDWKKQGVGFFSSHIPEGITFIQNKDYTLSQISDKIRCQLDKSKRFRSEQTQGLYELIVTIDGFLKRVSTSDHWLENQTINKILMIFCETYSSQLLSDTFNTTPTPVDSASSPRPHG